MDVRAESLWVFVKQQGSHILSKAESDQDLCSTQEELGPFFCCPAPPVPSQQLGPESRYI